MFSSFWNLFLYNPLLQILLFLYKITGNFGAAIILLTVFIRTFLIPLTLPAIKSAKKMQDLKPKLDEIRKKHKHDNVKLQKEQLRLYQESGINPASGCLPYLIQFLILIALYQVFMFFISNGKVNGTPVNMKFLWLDLAKPDQTYLLPIFAGLTQFIMSLMMIPQELKLEKHPASKEEKKEIAKEEDMATAMNRQMMFLMPAMTIFIGVSLPSGLALYWIITTIFSIIQQYFTTGLGGLGKYLKFLPSQPPILTKK